MRILREEIYKLAGGTLKHSSVYARRLFVRVPLPDGILIKNNARVIIIEYN